MALLWPTMAYVNINNGTAVDLIYKSCDIIAFYVSSRLSSQTAGGGRAPKAPGQLP